MSSLSFFLVHRAKRSRHANDHAGYLRCETGQASRAAALVSRARALPSLNMKKNRDCSQSIYAHVRIYTVLYAWSTSVEPVKAILSTSMCSAIAIPAVGPYPGTKFTTPGGKPAWKIHTDKKIQLQAFDFNNMPS